MPYDPKTLRNLTEYAHEVEEAEKERRKSLPSKKKPSAEPSKPSASSLAELLAKFSNKENK